MNARSLLHAVVFLGATAASGLFVRSQAAELNLQVTQTSPTAITIEWSQPASSTGFHHYDVFRSAPVRVGVVNGALAFFAVALGVVALSQKKRRQRRSAWAGALGLSLGIGIHAWAAINYEKINQTPITDFNQTTYVDNAVEADEGYYYKVDADFGDHHDESMCAYGTAQDPVSFDPDTNLVTRFVPGSGPNLTPEDGAILGTFNVTMNGCVAETEAGCGGDPAGDVHGELRVNLGLPVGGDLTGGFSQSVNLNEGPNYVALRGSNAASGKNISVAKTLSVGTEGTSGTLIEKAVGVAVSPKPTSGDSLLEKIRQQISALTAAEANELLAQLPYPIALDVNDPQFTLDIDISQIVLDSDGDPGHLTATKLELSGTSATSAAFDLDLLVDGATVRYTNFGGSIHVGGLNGLICPHMNLNRLRLGKVRLRAHGTVQIAADQLQLDVTQLGADPFLEDVSTLPVDKFDSDRKVQSELLGCNPGPGGVDPDDLLFGILNTQITELFPIDVTETTISDIALGDTGLSLDLKVAEISQDADGKGLVVRVDAGLDAPSPVPFLRTDNLPPNGTANNSVFPDAFPTALDAGFTVADDLANEGLAAARAAGLLDGVIDSSLKFGAETVPLTVQGLDPGPSSEESILPNLSRHAPVAAPVRIETSFTKPPVVGLESHTSRAQAGLRVLATSFTAKVLVDVDRDGAYDADCETLVTLDLDALASTNVELTEAGGLHFVAEITDQGYTATPGFYPLPHAEYRELAEAIVQNRADRILGVINGDSGDGLIIAGLTFSTMDAVADGDDQTTLYLDYLTAWGAADIDLKILIQTILDLVNAPPRR